MRLKARYCTAVCLLDNTGKELLRSKASFVVRDNFKAKPAMSADVHEDATLSIMGTLVIAWEKQPPQGRSKDVVRSLVCKKCLLQTQRSKFCVLGANLKVMLVQCFTPFVHHGNQAAL